MQLPTNYFTKTSKKTDEGREMKRYNERAKKTSVTTNATSQLKILQWNISSIKPELYEIIRNI
jgi:hypothetical protein